ncbi:hypothetical protein [Congregibacter litoralis]|uniref:Uncharacterized protein n=1 Tax=Congregibacter litoralis KT71 TaxID=314285 RepID=A4A5T5_9GAMM|nr:hypothetical protein [Congregibacter litoralis]EAQ98382.1 hypothetical protein KT71_00355 [Congregibacter litoralis KT71]
MRLPGFLKAYFLYVSAVILLGVVMTAPVTTEQLSIAFWLGLALCMLWGFRSGQHTPVPVEEATALTR